MYTYHISIILWFANSSSSQYRLLYKKINGENIQLVHPKKYFHRAICMTFLSGVYSWYVYGMCQPQKRGIQRCLKKSWVIFVAIIDHLLTSRSGWSLPVSKSSYLVYCYSADLVGLEYCSIFFFTSPPHSLTRSSVAAYCEGVDS